MANMDGCPSMGSSSCKIDNCGVNRGMLRKNTQSSTWGYLSALRLTVLMTLAFVSHALISDVTVQVTPFTTSSLSTFVFSVLSNQQFQNGDRLIWILHQDATVDQSNPYVITMTGTTPSGEVTITPTQTVVSTNPLTIELTMKDVPAQFVPNNYIKTTIKNIRTPQTENAGGERVLTYYQQSVTNAALTTNYGLPAIVPGELSGFSLTPTVRMLGYTTEYMAELKLRNNAMSGEQLAITFPTGTQFVTGFGTKDVTVQNPDNPLEDNSFGSVTITGTTLSMLITNVGGTFVAGRAINLKIAGVINPMTQPQSLKVIGALKRNNLNRDTKEINLSLFTNRCPKGRYSTNLDGVCVDCAAGKFGATDGLSACVDCALGEFASEVKSESCKPCELGTFAGSRGTSKCSECIPGHHADVTGLSVCKLCLVGRFSKEYRSVNCQDCAIGTYAQVEASPTCLDCPVGKTTILTGRSICDLCVSGRYKTTNDDCITCVGGKYTSSPNIQTACLVCIPGKFSDSGAAGCINCSSGKYAPTSGSAACRDCPAGRFTSLEAQSGCTLCTGGKAAIPGSISCTDCEPGQFAPTGSGACTPCAKGFFSTAQAATCSRCIEGDYADSTGRSICSRCAPGTFSSQAGSSICSDCKPGSYTDLQRQSACTLCAVNWFTNSPASSTCTPCQANHYAPTPGSTACTYVPPGCPPGTRFAIRPDSQQTYCHACEVGKVTSAYSQEVTESCTPCEKGKYASSTSMSICTQCEYGKYASNAGSSACISCKLGYEAPDRGSTTCLACNPGYSTLQESSRNCHVCLPGTIAPAKATPLCESCAVGRYADQNGQTACMNCPTGTVTSGRSTDKMSKCVVPLCEDLSSKIASLAPLRFDVQPGQYGVNKVGSKIAFSCPTNGDPGVTVNYILVGEKQMQCVAPSTANADHVAVWESDPTQVRGVWMPDSIPKCVAETTQELFYQNIAKLALSTAPPTTLQQGEKFSVAVDALTTSNLLVRNAGIVVELVLNTTNAVISNTQNSREMLSNPKSIRVHGSNFVVPVQGRAAFSMLELHTVGSGFVLQANVFSLENGSPSTRSIASAYSDPITVLVTPPVRLVVKAPLRVTAGIPFPQLVTVMFANTLGHPVSADKAPNSLITLGIVEEDFWFANHAVGQPLSQLPNAGSVSFQDVTVMTSRVLTDNSATFRFYASTPEFKTVESSPIRIFRDAANNEISRFREYLRPTSFTVVVFSLGFNLAASEANTLANSAYRKLFKEDICYALSLTTAGCERVHVLEAVSVAGEVTVSDPTSVYPQGYYRIRVQLNPPRSLSSKESSGVVVASISSNNDALISLRTMLKKLDYQPPHRSAFAMKQNSFTDVSFAEIEAASIAASEIASHDSQLMTNEGFNNSFESQANPILETVSADAATSSELLQSLESQFASEPNSMESSDYTTPLIYMTTFAALAEGASFTVVASSSQQTATPDSLVPIDTTKSKPIAESTGFIAGLSGGLGGAFLVIVIIIVVWRVRMYYIKKRQKVSRPVPVEEPTVTTTVPTSKSTQLFYSQPPSKSRTPRTRHQYVGEDGTVSRQVVFHV